MATTPTQNPSNKKPISSLGTLTAFLEALAGVIAVIAGIVAAIQHGSPIAGTAGTVAATSIVTGLGTHFAGNH